jgi:hypothetical protein
LLFEQQQNSSENNRNVFLRASSSAFVMKTLVISCFLFFVI